MLLLLFTNGMEANTGFMPINTPLARDGAQPKQSMPEPSMQPILITTLLIMGAESLSLLLLKATVRTKGYMPMCMMVLTGEQRN